jgi:GNAT superfamily N-acetyltransferase
VLNHFKQRALPFQWHLGPTSQPTEAGDILQAHGINHDEDEPGMAIDLLQLKENVPVSQDIDISPVLTAGQLDQWVRVWGCGAPEEISKRLFACYAGLRYDQTGPLRFYLGTLDGEPVATTALFFGAGVVQIKHVVTVHHARRQGIGAAMTLMAAREARNLGYRIAVLSASPKGINIYRRFGFQEYCTMSTYHWYP